MAEKNGSRIITDAREFARHGVNIHVRYIPRVDFVLVKRIDDELDKSAGGIIIPDQAQTQSNKGRVMATGPGRWIQGTLVPTGLDQGDVVVFSKYGAEEIVLDGEEYLLIRADEVKLKEQAVIS